MLFVALESYMMDRPAELLMAIMRNLDWQGGVGFACPRRGRSCQSLG